MSNPQQTSLPEETPIIGDFRDAEDEIRQEYFSSLQKEDQLSQELTQLSKKSPWEALKKLANEALAKKQ